MQEIFSNNAPEPIGPYSQAVISGNFLFISGQIAIDAKSGEFVSGTVEDETELVLSNLEAILKEAHLGFKNVCKSEIYLTNLEDFSKVNAIYEKRITGSPKPARATVGVLSLPKGAKVEISMIAEKGIL